MKSKATLRKEFAERRKKTENRKKKSKDIAASLISLPCFSSSQTVAIYKCMPCEVETDALIETMLHLGKRVCLPVCEENGKMEFYEITSLSDAENKSSLGIFEPSSREETKIRPESIDLAVIPGVCFDESKRRIGFGGGYYDRFLPKAKNAVKAALCFESQILKGEGIPSDEHDIKMDMLITEEKVYR